MVTPAPIRAPTVKATPVAAAPVTPRGTARMAAAIAGAAVPNELASKSNGATVTASRNALVSSHTPLPSASA